MSKLLLGLAVVLAATCLTFPELASAAAEKADMLVVVADSRRVSSGWSRYFLDVYNTNPFMFGVWCADPDRNNGRIAGAYHGLHYEAHRDRPDI